MKPSIERELEAIRQALRALEDRLKNEREPLGHREVFSVGRRGEVPAPTRDDITNNRVLRADSTWAAQTGGSGGGLSTVSVDNLTIGGDGSSTYPLSASLLSATLDARIKNLSGSIDGRFNSLSYLSAVSHNSTLSGDGTSGNPLSAAPTFVAAQTAITASINGLSGTLDARWAAALSSSQAWSQTANGTEGTTLTAVIPLPFAGTQYYAFVTNYTGSASPVFKITNKTSASFQVVSTAPFSNGDKVDLLAISGGLGPLADVNAIAVLSGTIDARFINLSGTVDGHFNALSGTIDARFNAVNGVFNPQTTMQFYDDFITDTLSNFGSAGGTSNTAFKVTETGHPGIRRLNVDNSASVAYTYHGGGAAAIWLFGGGVITWEAVVRIPTLSDGTQNISCRAGFLVVGATPANDAVCFDSDRSRFGDSTWRITVASTGSRHSYTTGQTPTANTWYRLRLEINAAGTDVTASIDGTQVLATTMVYVPGSTPTNVWQPAIVVTKTLGSTQRNFDADYMMVRQDLTTSR